MSKLRQKGKRRKVTIIPSPSFEEDARVYWQPEGSVKQYPIAIQCIFPFEAFDSLWTSMSEGKSIVMPGFAYVPYERLVNVVDINGKDSRIRQFERSGRKLLWLGPALE